MELGISSTLCRLSVINRPHPIIQGAYHYEQRSDFELVPKAI